MNCRAQLPLVFAALVVILGPSVAQVPPLPEGVKTRWEMAGIEEIAVWVLFDQALVSERVPQGFRFFDLEELAAEGPTPALREAARSHLAAHPEHRRWDVSFVELTRARHFAIDGRKPTLPEHGAFGVWLAPLTPKVAEKQPGGRSTLELLIVVPDHDYVNYMRQKGHYAEYGDARLWRDESNSWKGRFETAGLRVTGACTPAGEERELRPQSQRLYQPAPAKRFLMSALYGYRMRECPGSWSFSGTHPLAKAVVLGGGAYLTGNSLGGAYDFPSQK